MLRKTVSIVRENASKLGFKPAMKYTININNMGRMRSKGRSLVFLATKYALSLYISTDLSLTSIARS